MTDDQVQTLIEKSANITKDLLFAYVAEVEIRLQALENLLMEKKVFQSREELENEQQSVGSRNFKDVIKGYDSLVMKNHNLMRKLRSSQ